MGIRIFTIIFFYAFLIFFVTHSLAQQVVDSTFRYNVKDPAFKGGDGPLVLVDIYHHDQDVKEGNYQPLFNLLQSDGFRIQFLDTAFTQSALKAGTILIIIDALSEKNIDNWTLPVYPAFTEKEAEAVYEWVMQGGSLLLSADHMPFAKSASVLAGRFGATFSNGFAIDTVTWDPLIFRKEDKTLTNHDITNGLNQNDEVDSVATFWGSAFQIDKNKLEGIFLFGDNVITYDPDTAWRFRSYTPTYSVKGWCQAAAGHFGKGRVVILGEAGMLTAQLTGPKRIKTGMNSSIAKQNALFILNIMHWLTGISRY